MANKAVLAAVLAFLGVLVKELTEKNPVSFRDWVVIVSSALITGVGVYVVPNRPLKG